jgi:squalene-hopene/tetraprenyl-beta-curcumene cyclase
MTKVQIISLIAFALMLLPASSIAEEMEGIEIKSRSDVSRKLEIENAIGKGLMWLAGQQNAEGWWSQSEHPALTGLVLTAFQEEPSSFYKSKYEGTIKRGYSYLLKNVKPDGGIYGKGLANYNTSVAVMALLVANRPEYGKTIRNARNFLIGLQDDQGETGMGDSPFDGGIGYGGTYQHSDLSNTMFALEAIYYTQHLKSDVGSQSEVKDLNWDAAIQFISRTQNLPESNDQRWASDDPANKGGFIYFPGDSKAGADSLPDGRVALRSYGSMSYAGLLSLIYAQLDRDDPRVSAVYDWLTRNYTLEENPGLGQQGLFYYFHTMAKALHTYGVDTLTLSDGKKINWREDLAKRLLDLQNKEGFWVNENSRWWERDPVLVTSYSVIVLEIIWRGI